MRLTLLALFVLVPALVMGQSLAEVAKKEKSRREKNKQEGKQAQVISETDLNSVPKESGGEAGSEESAPAATSSYGSSESSSRESGSEEGSEEDRNLPAFIPPDAPLPEKLDLFERMKRQYEREVKEIDEAIAKNDTRLKELESEIAAASALGGAGLPVAPQTGTGAATRPMTGQESASLVGEQNRLKEANAQLRARKEELKTNLVAKGHAAGIPPGYLRF
jgi:hypothetical protein